jgi:hypothetical protein
LDTPLFQQCKNCVVAVSQTKIGVCLQFLWARSTRAKGIYVSVDLIPPFKVEDIDPLKLARIINTGIIQNRPKGWFKYLQKYVKSDLIVTDLMQASGNRSPVNGTVLMKNFNYNVENNYYVRPGQHLGVKEFRGAINHIKNKFSCIVVL